MAIWQDLCGLDLKRFPFLLLKTLLCMNWVVYTGCRYIYIYVCVCDMYMYTLYLYKRYPCNFINCIFVFAYHLYITFITLKEFMLYFFLSTSTPDLANLSGSFSVNLISCVKDSLWRHKEKPSQKKGEHVSWTPWNTFVPATVYSILSPFCSILSLHMFLFLPWGHHWRHNFPKYLSQQCISMVYINGCFWFP